jgi:transitional endoplasmic reticulum ATPase
MTTELTIDGMRLTVSEIFIEDVGKGLARFDPDDARALGASLGDVIEVIGEKKTVARVSGIFPEYLGKKIIQIDGMTRENARVQIGGTVEIKKAPRQTATALVLTPFESGNWWPDESEAGYIGKTEYSAFWGQGPVLFRRWYVAFRSGNYQSANQVHDKQARL